MIHTQANKVVPIIKPQAIVDNAEWVGSKGSTPVSIDTNGFDYLDVYVLLGAMDIKMAVMKLHESDDDSTYTAITGGDFGSPDALPTATDDNKLYAWRVKLNGTRKRYVQVELKGGDGAAGTYAACIAVLSRAKQGPDTAAERGVTGSELFV